MPWPSELSQAKTSQLNLLLEGSQPREPKPRKQHPLYLPPKAGGSAAAHNTGGRRRGGGGRSASRPASAGSSPTASGRRARSQPASPTGVTKPRAAHTSGRQGPAAGRARGHASAGTSPVKQHEPGRSLRQLDFSTPSPGLLSSGLAALFQQQQQQQQAPQGQQQHQLPAPFDPAVDFARLRIVSPAASPHSSPRPGQQQVQAPAAATPSASQPSADSQWRWQQYQQQQRQQQYQQQQQRLPHQQAPPPQLPSQPPGSPVGSGGGSWCVAPSPDAPQPGQQPRQPSAPPFSAAAAPSPSPSPFKSSQERRQEIALLCEMAVDVGAWSSQEEEAAAGAAAFSQTPRQQPGQLAQQQQQGGGGSPLQRQLSQEPSQPAAPACSQGSADGSAGGRRPYICSFTSQELTELADPWSQSTASQEQPGQQQQQQEQQQQAGCAMAAAGGEQQGQAAGAEGMQVDGCEDEARQGARQAALQPAAPPPAPAQPGAAARLQQQYQQRGAGLNQWAFARPPSGAPQQAAAPAMLRPELGTAELARQQAQREREAAEDQLVAGTCSLPCLREVRASFPTQRDAFAAADAHNRGMPRLQPPQIILSVVPPEELLVPAGGTAGGTAGAAGASSGSGGAASSSAGGGGSRGSKGSGAGLQGEQEAQSAAPGQQQQAGAAPEAPPSPCDFLSRYRKGVLPAAGSSGYNTAHLAPLAAKRPRPECGLPLGGAAAAPATLDAGSEQQGQQDQAARQAAARQEYEAALRALQQAAAEDQERRLQEHAQARQQQQALARQRVQGQHAHLKQQQQQQQGQGQPLAGQAVPAAGSRPGSGAVLGPAGSSGAAAGASEEGRQEEAVRTFCVERRGRNGAYFRSFCAASYPAVWSLFRRTPCAERHWYEVVREGRPAHLYFDLEYDPRLNPQADGDALVDRLLAHVEAQLRRHFGLPLDRRCIYELDSSTPAKFSRHLTVRLPGHAFATNHGMGKFVAQVLAASGEELLLVRGEREGAPQRGSMVDTAVYSKNRHWRMSYCCKGGKDAVLRPTRRYATADGATTSIAHVFLDTLVCNVDPRARLLQMPDPLPGTLGFGRGAGGAGPGGPSGVVAAVTVADGGGGTRTVAWKRDAGDVALPQAHLEELQRLAEAALPFIERVATQRAGGAPARARTLAFCGAGATVAYSMIGPGSHYCENMGRAHGSNHVFFVADFVRGAYAQKCHDPDCSRFRSGWMPLPPELCLPEARAAAMGLGPPSPSPSTSSRRSGSRG